MTGVVSLILLVASVLALPTPGILVIFHKYLIKAVIQEYRQLCISPYIFHIYGHIICKFSGNLFILDPLENTLYQSLWRIHKD